MQGVCAGETWGRGTEVSMVSVVLAIVLCAAYGIFLEIWTRRKALAVQNRMPDFVGFGVKDVGSVRKIEKRYRCGVFFVVSFLVIACFPMALMIDVCRKFPDEFVVGVVMLPIVCITFYMAYSFMNYMRLSGVYCDDEMMIWRNWKTGQWDAFAYVDIEGVKFSRESVVCYVRLKNGREVKLILLSDSSMLRKVAVELMERKYEKTAGVVTRIYDKISNRFK